MSLVILKPTNGEAAYTQAAIAFQTMYQQVTHRDIVVTEQDDGISDLIVIGSDAVNDFLMNEVLEVRLDSLHIRYGTDDYCLRSYHHNGRRVLILAGGRGRSTLYAVYDYFERFGGCHYFWDGDVIPHQEELPLENINVLQTPRFDYRGLRYFAHRGLKRFQAEHWSFEDWKQELDWMVKKRLNFFMLRIGMDDIWQRAFPDDVPYPDDYRTITGIDAEGYNDRSDFWTLKFRGELKIKVLEYARRLDLIYPVDCGTMTHWYSRTPVEFLENRKPRFLCQADDHYVATDTGRVLDFTKQDEMDHYMRLTETMVNEHEKTDALFHTIGLGERRIYEDKAKNFALKLVAYRRVAQNIRTRYPHSKLMIASWDFLGWWTPAEVQELLAEFDPERTILLDYTSDGNDPTCSFVDWGVVGKFPWIFGLFHAYESESELRGAYDRSDERLRIAAADPLCKGMVFWPELSHSDPLVLEYLSQNAWSPLEYTIEEIAERFCQNRYGDFAQPMNVCWQNLLPFIKTGDWGGFSHRTPDDEQYIEYIPNWYTHQDLWPKPLAVLKENTPAMLRDLIRFYEHKADNVRPTLHGAVTALRTLAADQNVFDHRFVFRDAIDMTRTVLGRLLNFTYQNALASQGDEKQVEQLSAIYFEGLELLAQLLSTHPDYSVYRSLLDLQTVAPVNPDFERTLKRNIGCRYGSGYAYEVVKHLVKDEATVAFDILKHGKTPTPAECDERFASVFAKFENTPLTAMQPTAIPAPHDVVRAVADFVERNAHQI